MNLGKALLRALALASLMVLAVTGCKRPEADASVQEDRLVVFAASSLRDAFTAMGEEFERTHPGVELTFNFAGTQALRTQLENGAAVDVFASADQRHMDELVQASRVQEPAVFARNEPVLIVSRESAATLQGLGELPKAERIVIGVPEVPIGRYTLQILDKASAALGPDFRSRVEARVVSRELNVRQVLAKVSLGEAQAGFVYRTDALSAGDRVRIVALPPELNVIAEYPIGRVTGAAHPVLARAWIDFVLSADGQRLLGRAGFAAPSGRSSAP
ncbi:molybdate transport system substrate-binding protein [Archangium gephyra]|uniref:Molybdate transport system substrate-binding protein n=1 Tax=Archangium gephyra TaxID=48 RepID=A0AAC8QB83_9BACT|nr:molybdate ABC transporter substrate-binding protein [Archangium gephyra]AKJ04145.1 Molybdenum ABC transporter, periplasmic molybdenum-binding protein ModA [Archangium gephyra]REG37771.1 molybdate transport system substrate-binding protein [Archangium gephyra]